ncbi:unnamed protein product, partial [Rotaria magnacalcarata]
MQSSTANINHGHKPGEISVSIFGQNDDDNDDDDDYDSRGVKEFSQYNYDLTKNTFNIDCDNVDDNQIILLALYYSAYTSMEHKSLIDLNSKSRDTTGTSIISALTMIEEDADESDSNLVEHQNITNSRHQQMDKNLFSTSTKHN